MPDLTLTPALIATHERLHPCLASLLKQIERVAAKHPGLGVPEETARLARELCRDAAKLLGRAGRGISVPQRSSAGTKSTPLDHATLAIALGQALVGLEAFEAEHSGWSGTRKCAVWRLDGPERPVRRLLPPGHEGEATRTRNPDSEAAKADLMRLILSRYAAGYDEGYQQAREGKPPSSRYAEEAWDGLVEQAGGSDERARLRELKRRYGSTTPPAHVLPVGAVPGEWQRLDEAEFNARAAALRSAAEQAAPNAK